MGFNNETKIQNISALFLGKSCLFEIVCYMFVESFLRELFCTSVQWWPECIVLED